MEISAYFSSEMMKKYIALFVLALCLALFQGCSKDSGTVSYTMRAIINGVAYTSSGITAQQTNSLLIITGKASAGSGYPNMELYISNYTGVGTYSLVSPNYQNFADIDSSAFSNRPASVSGSIVITAASPDIIGTFSFTMDDATKVTKGTFASKQP